jgi:hypothetical protein
VFKIHEAEKKQQGEASAHLGAVREKIQALRNKQEEDLSATVAMIVEETEAKLKESFSKIHAQLNRRSEWRPMSIPLVSSRIQYSVLYRLPFSF